MPDPADLCTLEVSRTARVATIGPLDVDTWWVVLHGYGQLATDIAAAARPLTGPSRCLVAPEGLSRFYVDGMDAHNEVGASWMTREGRDDEIRDYVRYLDSVVSQLRPPGPMPSLHVLGFSQGAATASRWALLGQTSVDRLVLWGGVPAHDLDLPAHTDDLRALDLTLVAGTDDPHVSLEQCEATLDRLRAYDISVSFYTFEGGHRLDDDILQELTRGSASSGLAG